MRRVSVYQYTWSCVTGVVGVVLMCVGGGDAPVNCPEVVAWPRWKVNLARAVYLAGCATSLYGTAYAVEQDSKGLTGLFGGLAGATGISLIYDFVTTCRNRERVAVQPPPPPPALALPAVPPAPIGIPVVIAPAPAPAVPLPQPAPIAPLQGDSEHVVRIHL